MYTYISYIYRERANIFLLLILHILILISQEQSDENPQNWKLCEYCMGSKANKGTQYSNSVCMEFHYTTFVACYMAVYLFYLHCTSYGKIWVLIGTNVTALNWKQILCTKTALIPCLHSFYFSLPLSITLTCYALFRWSMQIYTYTYTRVQRSWNSLRNTYSHKQKNKE